MRFTPLSRSYNSHDEPPVLVFHALQRKARLNARACKEFGIGKYSYIKWCTGEDGDTIAILLLECREADSYKISDSSGGVEFYAVNLLSTGKVAGGKFSLLKEKLAMDGMERDALTFKISEGSWDGKPSRPPRKKKLSP